MNLLCDFLLWATVACVVLAFVFLAITAVLLFVIFLVVEFQVIFRWD